MTFAVESTTTGFPSPTSVSGGVGVVSPRSASAARRSEAIPDDDSPTWRYGSMVRPGRISSTTSAPCWAALLANTPPDTVGEPLRCGRGFVTSPSPEPPSRRGCWPTGSITAPELLELYLDRVARLDRELRSYRVVLADTARQEAGVAQDRLNAGERLPLLGVPIAIKDDVDVAGEVTTYGTAAYGPAPTQDAEVVRRLREAGAVIVGKTAVPEMMIWSFTETVTFGATRNPWNTDYTPGGSSGGSGAAVAAGLAAMALGSDGMGSIRIPSTWCGLFGVKPQRDRVPISPHDDAWNGLSVNGPMARTVEDAALFLDVTTADGGFRRGSGERAGAAAYCVEHQGASTAEGTGGRGTAGRGRGGRGAAARARARGDRPGP